MSGESAVEAQLTAGTIAGRRVGEVLRFSAVPYAAPPVGAGRFALPQPVEPWTGVRAAHRPGPAPPQPAAGDELVPGMTPAATSEDCLTAEVWTPSVEGRRPVLVWVPGGRYQIGGASLRTYDGARLAGEGDLVVVGLNYRLGALGFLYAEGVPANLGLRDLLAALHWLRDEVAAFGGDPDRIVVIGESAGAGAITHLLAVAGTADLVAGAIVQSGAPAATLDPETATLVGRAVMDAAGAASVADLRTVPVDALVAAQDQACTALLGRVGMMPLHPVVDGDLLRATPLEAAAAGTLAPVALVVGTTAQEMELFRTAVPQLDNAVAVPFLAAKLAPVLGARPPDETVRRGLAAVGGDLVEAIADTDLHSPAALLADSHARRGLPVWRYRFAWPSPGIGAAHATDLPFTFGTLDVEGWRSFVGADDPERRATADQLSRRMRSAWTSFCHDLEPACDPVGPWPRHDPPHRPVVCLDRTVEVVEDPDGDRIGAWTRD